MPQGERSRGSRAVAVIGAGAASCAQAGPDRIGRLASIIVQQMAFFRSISKHFISDGLVEGVCNTITLGRSALSIPRSHTTSDGVPCAPTHSAYSPREFIVIPSMSDSFG